MVCTLSRSSSLVRPNPIFAMWIAQSARCFSSAGVSIVAGPGRQPMGVLSLTLFDNVLLGI